jgi:hypothetical protein
MPRWRFASPVNLFLRVLNVSNIAMVDLSSFTLPRPFVTMSVNILICWFFRLNSQHAQHVKCHKAVYVPNNAQHLFIDASMTSSGGNKRQDNSA